MVIGCVSTVFAEAESNSPEQGIKSNCIADGHQCFKNPNNEYTNCYTKPILKTNNTDLTLSESGEKIHIEDGSFSFEWKREGGDWPTKAWLTHIVIYDNKSAEEYDFDAGEISDFSVNDAKACFGYKKTSDWYGTVSAKYKGSVFASVDSWAGTNGSTACGKITLTQEGGKFRVPSSMGASASSFYPIILKQQ